MEIIDIIWLPQEMFWGWFSLIERICQLLTCTNYVGVQIKVLGHCRRLPVRLCAKMGPKWTVCMAEPLMRRSFKKKRNISLATVCPLLGNYSLIIKGQYYQLNTTVTNCGSWEAGWHGLCAETTASNSKIVWVAKIAYFKSSELERIGSLPLPVY